MAVWAPLCRHLADRGGRREPGGPEAARLGSCRETGFSKSTNKSTIIEEVADLRPLRRTTFLSCALLLAAALLWCDAEPPAGKSACVFPFADLSPAAGDAERRNALSDALSTELQTAGITLLPQEKWQGIAEKLSITPIDLLEGPAAARLAAEAGAELAVSGFFSMEKERILICVSFYDAKANDLVAGFIGSWRFDLGLYNSLHSEVAALLPKIRLSDATPPAAEGEAAPGLPLSRIAFTSMQDGIEVVLAGDKSAGVTEGGELVVPMEGMKAGTPLFILKRKDGFHASWQAVRAAPQVTLSPLAKKTTLAAEAIWTYGQILGVGGAFRYYPIPDWLFIAASAYPSVQSPFTPGSVLVLHSDIGIQAGLYLIFAPESPFRLGFSTGAGAIFTNVLTPAIPASTDFYLNPLNLWVEWNLPGVSFFLREEIKYALGGSDSLLGMGIISIRSIPPITLGALFKWQ